MEASFETIDVVIVSPVGDLEAWLQFIAEIRTSLSGALVFVPQESGAADCVRAFDAGADDCVAEGRLDIDFVSRIQAILRRTCVDRRICRHCGPVRIDTALHTVRVSDQRVHVTQREYRILELLASQPYVPVSRDELLLHACGPEYDGDWDLLRKCVFRLRRKLEPFVAEGRSLIVNERGAGYLLTDGSAQGDGRDDEALESSLVGNSS
jgi:DNA-binding response OmpR family regulator